jgi:hypothetical protein
MTSAQDCLHEDLHSWDCGAAGTGTAIAVFWCLVPCLSVPCASRCTHCCHRKLAGSNSNCCRFHLRTQSRTPHSKSNSRTSSGCCCSAHWRTHPRTHSAAVPAPGSTPRSTGGTATRLTLALVLSLQDATQDALWHGTSLQGRSQSRR